MGLGNNSWEDNVNNKREEIKRLYEEINCNDLELKINNLKNQELGQKSYNGYDYHRTVVDYLFFLLNTLQRYKDFIPKEYLDNKIKQINDYSNNIQKNEDARKFHNFIEASWGDYKELKNNVNKVVNKLDQISETIETKNDNSPKELDNNIAKLKQTYETNLTDLSNKLKSEAKN